MTTPPLFNSPLLLGFEELERVLDRVSKASSDGYPPYNIEQVDADRLRITLAVAGFSRDDLNVTLEDNQLVVRGRRTEDEAPRTYLHRGIAARQFQRAFVLAEGIEIIGAELADGLLSIDLVRPRPTEVVRRVEIKDGEAARRSAGQARRGKAMTFGPERAAERDVVHNTQAEGSPALSASAAQGSPGVVREPGRVTKE